MNDKYDDASFLIMPQVSVGAPLSIPERDELEILRKENLKLKGAIDEANAQEPAGYMVRGSFFYSKVEAEKSADHLTANYENTDVINVYVDPIPAQQSPALETTELFSADQWWVSELNDATKNGTPDQQRAYYVVLNLLRQVKQSPAVAVPKNWRLTEKKTCHALMCGNEVIATLAGSGAQESAAIIAKLLSSSRITEQDAFSIIDDFLLYCREKKESDIATIFFDEWIESEGCALLNKLNEANHAQ